jgi:catechol 2,3-dioxygenase-like lactoylglutathione lyase family enzyme
MGGETVPMRSAVAGIDHVAITVVDIDAACAFYTQALGAEIVMDHRIGGRSAVRGVRIGGAMLNIHQHGNGMDLVARAPTPGSVDLCLRWDGDIASAEARLAEAGICLRDGPLPRMSSRGILGQSVYFLDPDGNLIELLAEGAPPPR